MKNHRALIVALLSLCNVACLPETSVSPLDALEKIESEVGNEPKYSSDSSSSEERIELTPSACKDGKEKFLYNGKMRTCKWLSKRNNQMFIDEVCRKKAAAVCRKTCNNCPSSITKEPTSSTEWCDDNERLISVRVDITTNYCYWDTSWVLRDIIMDIIVFEGGSYTSYLPSTAKQFKSVPKLVSSLRFMIHMVTAWMLTMTILVSMGHT